MHAPHLREREGHLRSSLAFSRETRRRALEPRHRQGHHDDGALALCGKHSWPCNVHTLENVIGGEAVNAKVSPRVFAEHLMKTVLKGTLERRSAAGTVTADFPVRTKGMADAFAAKEARGHDSEGQGRLQDILRRNVVAYALDINGGLTGRCRPGPEVRPADRIEICPRLQPARPLPEETQATPPRKAEAIVLTAESTDGARRSRATPPRGTGRGAGPSGCRTPLPTDHAPGNSICLVFDSDAPRTRAREHLRDPDRTSVQRAASSPSSRWACSTFRMATIWKALQPALRGQVSMPRWALYTTHTQCAMYATQTQCAP
jgi:hypothetical protein